MGDCQFHSRYWLILEGGHSDNLSRLFYSKTHPVFQLFLKIFLRLWYSLCWMVSSVQGSMYPSLYSTGHPWDLDLPVRMSDLPIWITANAFLKIGAYLVGPFWRASGWEYKVLTVATVWHRCFGFGVSLVSNRICWSVNCLGYMA